MREAPLRLVSSTHSMRLSLFSQSPRALAAPASCHMDLVA